MGGLVIDIYVEFLYRLVVSLLKRHRSSNWPRTEAEVMSSQCLQASYGCDVAEIYYNYKYRINGELFVGVHEKGFVSNSAGRDYADKFQTGRKIIVRVNPADPSIPITLINQPIDLSFQSLRSSFSVKSRLAG